MWNVFRGDEKIISLFFLWFFGRSYGYNKISNSYVWERWVSYYDVNDLLN